MQTYLKTVDELGERNILAVAEDMDGAEVLVGAVPELEPQELAGVGRRPAELNSQSRAKIGWRSTSVRLT